MRVDFKATGLNRAKNMSFALGGFIASHSGIEVGATSRKGKGETGTNANVTDSLADGGRDLGPSEDDGKKVAEAWVKRCEAFTRMQKDTPKPPSQQAVNQASGFALHRAADIIAKIMTDRIDASEDKNGNVIEVKDTYAKARAAKYSMADNTSEVFKASGQLLANFASGQRKLKK